MRFPKYDAITLRETTSITITGTDGKTFSFRIHQLPLDFDFQLERMVPPPVREDYASEKENEAAERLCNRKQATAMLVMSLEPGEMEFESKKEDFDTEQAWIDAVYHEMVNVISISQLNTLGRQIAEFNSMSNEQVEEATEDFLSEAEDTLPISTNNLPS